MLERVRSKSLIDWGIAAGFLVATLLMIWAVVVVDWWSTAIGLYTPSRGGGLAYVQPTRDGQSLLDAYGGLAMALLLVVPCGWIISNRNRTATGMLGVVGVALTVVASQLDSPIRGLVATNAWIPAALAWFFYFGALITAISIRVKPQLEFEERPDSSDG